MEELPKQRRTALAYGKCRTTGTIVLHTTSIQALHPCLGRSPRTRSHEPHEEQTGLPLQARWILAAAYALSDKARLPGELVYNLSTTLPEYARQNPVYGSALRDEALVLEALVR